MKACVLLGVMTSLLVTVSGQTTEQRLRNSYPMTVNGSFFVRPGVTIKPFYSANHRACVLSISGPISEQELIKTFETAVPEESRGLKKQEWLQCAGACSKLVEYEKVEFTSYIVGTQTSEPAALIVFKGRDCETVAGEANKIKVSVRQH